MKAIGDTLVALAENSSITDAQFRSLFLFAVCKRGAPPAGLEIVASLVWDDQRKLEERIEQKAERKRARAREQYSRTRKKSANSANSVDSATPTVLPAVQPACQPECSSSLRSEEREIDAPALEEVIAFAAEGATKPDGKPVDESFAREWFVLMQSSGWRNTRGRRIVPTWRNDMIYAWKRHLKFDRAPARTGGASNQPKGQTLHRSGYEPAFKL